MVTVFPGALSLAGILLAADQAPAAANGSSVALITAVGSLLGSVVAGITAYAISRRTPTPEIPAATPSPGTPMPPAELLALWKQERDLADDRATREQERADREAERADMWMRRAFEAGYRDAS